MGVETVVEPNMNVVKRGVLIGFVSKLGSGSSGVSARRNLSQSSTLPAATIGVVGILQVVFTNSIMATHGNMTTNWPLMSSMAVGGCIITNVMHSKSKYQEPIVVTTSIFDHKNGHYVRLNMVVFKYLNFKKDVNLDAHVKVFNFEVKENV